MKIFYLDVETTGLDAIKNDIVQLSYIVEIDGQQKDIGNLNIQPWDMKAVDLKALEINHLTMDLLWGFPHPADVFGGFLSLLERFVNKYNREDKFTLAGYNVQFDMNFLREFFKKAGSPFFGSYFSYKPFDIYSLVLFFALEEGWQVENHKLSTICKYLGIPLKAHDAMSDIMATQKVFEELRKRYRALKGEKK